MWLTEKLVPSTRHYDQGLQQRNLSVNRYVFPQDQNVSRKEYEKLSHSKDLQIRITKMWKLSTTIIPVVIGGLGMIKKGAEKYIKQLPGNSNLCELQKITLMGTAHLLRKALSV
uniref:Uncharacterized protein n=1 Tax=Octopus bimaculoides TaxID=37653 RepID=A0A0L8FLB2_OCTBM